MSSEVSAILLDAGGVLLFPEPDLLLPPLRAAGVSPDLAALERAHYRAMVGQDLAGVPPAAGTWWRDYLSGYVAACGVAGDRCAEVVGQVVEATRGTAWTHVGTGATDGMRALAALGLPMGIVSNSDGTVQAELRRLGVCYAPGGQDADVPGVKVGIVVDSAVAGVAKPDPAIFRIALDALGVPASRTVLHVGDSVRYDVAGAVAAGLQAVHLDPHGFCPAPDGHQHARSLAGLARTLAALSARRLPSAADRLRACQTTARK
ncbi:MAG TPA: HAD family hydrolase [Streptosporangiaceae bacterium]|nr:HAD family hydrolase [Streptosporangiaceae bacterium]